MKLHRALAWREADRSTRLEPPHDAAFRAFNGFVEGDPSLSLEVFGRCLVLHDRGVAPEGDAAKVRAACDEVFARWPWLTCALWKVRRSEDPALRNGRLLRGERGHLPTTVREHGVTYAIDLTLNRDASFYVDTSELRRWLLAECAGRSVFNAFAYTGSLGVAARAGGARRVVQVDRSARFLSLARRSWAANGWEKLDRRDMVVEDFFRAVARFKASASLFDLAIVDPPFFSQGPSGTVDLEDEPLRLLDKVQPLVAHGGRIVLVNNALFLSGARWLEALESRCAKGYLAIEHRIDVDPWSVGARDGDLENVWPSDPSPFLHPTKIVVLSVRRKDERRSNL